MKTAVSAEGIDALSTELRLLLLAYARMDNDGHAVFEFTRGDADQSELRDLLGRVNVKTGERVPCAESTIYKAKSKLAKAGLLVESSGGLRCVWVAPEHAERAKREKTMICPFHGASPDSSAIPGEQSPRFAETESPLPAET